MTDKKSHLKPKQVLLRKNYQSSEERTGPATHKIIKNNEDEW